MKSDQKISFVTNGFPTSSETFVINSVINAKKEGYFINILPEYVNYDKSHSMSELIYSNGLMACVFNSLATPESFTERVVYAFKEACKYNCLISLIKTINPALFGRSGINLRNYFACRRFIGAKIPELYMLILVQMGFWLKMPVVVVFLMHQ